MARRSWGRSLARRGVPIREIARQLGCSRNTVRKLPLPVDSDNWTFLAVTSDERALAFRITFQCGAAPVTNHVPLRSSYALVLSSTQAIVCPVRAHRSRPLPCLSCPRQHLHVRQRLR
jgi:hypothetical protein